MNNLFFRNILLTLGFVFITLGVFSQIPDEIVLSLKTGNDKTLATYFDKNVELVVPGSDDVYSKSQAQQLVAGFFKNNTPSDFSIIYKGGKEALHYAIGNLTTANGKFRVYFLLKTINKKVYIHQLRIEKKA